MRIIITIDVKRTHTEDNNRQRRETRTPIALMSVRMVVSYAHLHIGYFDGLIVAAAVVVLSGVR